MLSDPDWKLDQGTLLMVPVLNILGFERHSRYLPDRRDFEPLLSRQHFGKHGVAFGKDDLLKLSQAM